MANMNRLKIVTCVLSALVLAVSVSVFQVYGTSDDNLSASSHARMLVKIDLDTPDDFNALRDMHLDLASRSLKRGAHAIVTGEELLEIERRGYSYEILIDDPSKIRIDLEFRDYEETVAYLDSLVLEYPDITHLEQIGVSQEFALPIWALKISDNPETEEDEPEILFNGVHHAREPLSNEVCLGLARTLLEGYGVDPDLTAFIDEEEIWIVPIINTEGFKYLMDNNLSSPWWRKNQRDNNNNGMFDEDYDGVDINRNYDWYWSYGGSGNPSDWTYRGPFPFSESEMQSVRDLASLAHRFIFSISYHSYGEVVYWSWDWPNNPPPDEDVISEVAEELASRIPQRDGTGTYWAVAGDGQSGIARNWFYGVMGTIDFTVETCDEFIPSGTAIDSIVDANIPGALYLLDRALIGPGLTGHVTDSQTGFPLEATVFILDRDSDDIVPRTSEPNYGRYFRMLLPGEYDISFDLDGYGEIIEQVIVSPDTLTVLDVELMMVVDIDLAQTDVDDDLTGQSSGNGDGFLNPGETIELTAWFENIGILTAYSVSCTLGTQDTLVTLIEEYADYGDIAAGEVTGGDSPFVFSLSENAKDGEVVSLELIAADASANTWNFYLDFTVHAANIDFQSMIIDDSEGGDGDGFPEAGEVVDLIMTLRNNGTASASEVWVNISTSDPFLSIVADSSYFGDMQAGQVRLSEPPFTIAISPDVDDTSTATITLGINAVGHYEEEQLQIHFGPVSIEESGEEVALPRVTLLSQNYPNPFNPTTTIFFDLSGTRGVKQNVKLIVYDVRGRRVRTLIDSQFEPGSHRILWDGRTDRGGLVSSGVYYYTLRCEQSEHIRKMIVVR